MSGTTAKWAIPYSGGADIANTIDNTDLAKAALLDGLLAPFDQGAVASRPVSTPGSPGKVGRRYYATDLSIEFVDLGTAWAPAGLPIGGGFDWYGTGDPCAELMICDGRALSRATYAALFAKVTVFFGAGDGSTTFNIPDARDRVLVGVSGTIGRGATGGAKTHTMTTAEMPAHQHGMSSSGGGSGGNQQPDQVLGAVNGVTNPLTQASGGGSAHNNMQPYVASFKVIRVL